MVRFKKSSHMCICSLGLLVFELSELEAIFHIFWGSGDSKEQTLFSFPVKVEEFLISLNAASGRRLIEKDTKDCMVWNKICDSITFLLELIALA